MWKKIADFILGNRIPILIFIGITTVFMGYQAKDVKWSYQYIRIIPDDDPDMIAFNEFQSRFGEDASSFVLGIKDPKLYQLENFNKFMQLGKDIKDLHGITNVLSMANVPNLIANRKEQKFEIHPFFSHPPSTQAELDSIIGKEKEVKAFEHRLISKEGATAMVINMDPVILNSKNRTAVMLKLEARAQEFSDETGIKLYYAGMPYVRSIMANNVKKETMVFLGISIGVVALVLFLFFRSFSPVFYPLVVIGVVIVWIMGTLALFNYEITILTGLLPPVLVVIGIPNCIYLLNKYHQEIANGLDKRDALAVIIKKIGVVTLITNTTTAIGFMVLITTGIKAMQEFGIVAGINIAITFILSITFIPIVFSYLPAPQVRHLKHLEFKPTNWLIHQLEVLVTHYRSGVYVFTSLMVAVSIYGSYQVTAESYMVDDLPEDYHVKQDLRFFENEFSGVMPLEIEIDTKKKRGYMKKGYLGKVEEIEDFIGSLHEVSPPISINTFLKAANQSFHGGDSSFYKLPSRSEMSYIMKYARNSADDQTSSLSDAMIDSTGRFIRITTSMADIGSIKMENLVDDVIRPKLAEITKGTGLEAVVTGSTLIFIKGNDFLIKNLKQSMLIAFFLIAVIMGTLFGNIRIIIISLIPNIIPLLFTLGLMGFLGIPLKPSTAIVFSIAFGISVDDSIHFLAKYRQEIVLHNYNMKKAVIMALRETGASMLYTSIVLFCGFAIFMGSTFGATQALGLLTSVTLIVAMSTNLTLLPCLLYTFDVNKQAMHPIIDGMDTFYFEDEDEEIDIDRINVGSESEEEE
ncbi:efflux RND transporter permease subunit [Flammeovirga agarivorans]|uniref:MMPL family transporter n=1 Tax=Flammeovirga agarivorans TaxID=2726742 RepID=A0A7X8XWJ6_9BACT|nr:MMPL family transporter [Flammeovirga agarivorans]NLR92358.1 MMPL family transporter [Flammeovirga agarivorans]